MSSEFQLPRSRTHVCEHCDNAFSAQHFGSVKMSVAIIVPSGGVVQKSLIHSFDLFCKIFHFNIDCRSILNQRFHDFWVCVKNSFFEQRDFFFDLRSWIHSSDRRVWFSFVSKQKFKQFEVNIGIVLVQSGVVHVSLVS